MNCLIIDDNRAARTSLKNLISQIETLSLKFECTSALEAYNILQKEEIDLVLLDIEMPEMSGIELLRNLKKRPITILTSSKTEYAVEGFELNVADYIVKPVTMPRLLSAISRAQQIFDNKNAKLEKSDLDFIFIRDKGILSKLKIENILYIQALGSYVTIHTIESKVHTIHLTLLAIEGNLPKEKFYRQHRSYLIALDKIDRIEQETAYIGKIPLPIGEQYKKLLLEKLNLV
ncbi:MAG: LytTR family DNA-binding domain-containing protein [Bacteroidia bacterium]